MKAYYNDNDAYCCNWLSNMMDAGRYQAQYMYKATECQECGGTEDLERHHANEDATDNRPENVKVLCGRCHGKTHRKPPRQSVCVVCNQMFVAKDHRSRAKICSAPCVKEWGRINARKRWGAIA